MIHDQIIEYCLNKTGAYMDFPFDPTMPVIRVKAPSQEKGRIFAQLFFLHGEPKVTLNCTPESAERYRNLYPDSVVRGWHCPPVMHPHFNTISLDGCVPDDMIYTMIDHAYDVAVSKYPKYIQKEICELKKKSC